MEKENTDELAENLARSILAKHGSSVSVSPDKWQMTDSNENVNEQDSVQFRVWKLSDNASMEDKIETVKMSRKDYEDCVKAAFELHGNWLKTSTDYEKIVGAYDEALKANVESEVDYKCEIPNLKDPKVYSLDEVMKTFSGDMNEIRSAYGVMVAERVALRLYPTISTSSKLTTKMARTKIRSIEHHFTHCHGLHDTQLRFIEIFTLPDVEAARKIRSLTLDDWVLLRRDMHYGNLTYLSIAIAERMVETVAAFVLVAKRDKRIGGFACKVMYSWMERQPWTPFQLLALNTDQWGYSDAKDVEIAHLLAELFEIIQRYNDSMTLTRLHTKSISHGGNVSLHSAWTSTAANKDIELFNFFLQRNLPPLYCWYNEMDPMSVQLLFERVLMELALRGDIPTLNAFENVIFSELKKFNVDWSTLNYAAKHREDYCGQSSLLNEAVESERPSMVSEVLRLYARFKEMGIRIPQPGLNGVSFLMSCCYNKQYDTFAQFGSKVRDICTSQLAMTRFGRHVLSTADKSSFDLANDLLLHHYRESIKSDRLLHWLQEAVVGKNLDMICELVEVLENMDITKPITRKIVEAELSGALIEAMRTMSNDVSPIIAKLVQCPHLNVHAPDSLDLEDGVTPCYVVHNIIRDLSTSFLSWELDAKKMTPRPIWPDWAESISCLVFPDLKAKLAEA